MKKFMSMVIAICVLAGAFAGFTAPAEPAYAIAGINPADQAIDWTDLSDKPQWFRDSLDKSDEGWRVGLKLIFDEIGLPDFFNEKEFNELYGFHQDYEVYSDKRGFISQVPAVIWVGSFSEEGKSDTRKAFDKLSDHEKLMYVMKFYTSNWDYDKLRRPYEGLANWIEQGFDGICNDSANFWTTILPLIDIPCVMGGDNGLNHDYNFVLLDGYWYYLDFDSIRILTADSYYDFMGRYGKAYQYSDQDVRLTKETIKYLTKHFGGKVAKKEYEWCWICNKCCTDIDKHFDKAHPDLYHPQLNSYKFLNFNALMNEEDLSLLDEHFAAALKEVKAEKKAAKKAKKSKKSK